jgi:MYXO-CTERM domain-containing protein
MFPSSQSGSIAARDLSADEIEALHALYPARSVPTAALGDRSGGCRVAPGGDDRAAPLALFAGALALLLRRRRA